jgi:hypothetical protein
MSERVKWAIFVVVYCTVGIAFWYGVWVFVNSGTGHPNPVIHYSTGPAECADESGFPIGGC